MHLPLHNIDDKSLEKLYKDIYEKDINLEICEKLNDELTRQGAVVYMTRYGDYDLSRRNYGERKKSDLNNRATIINESGADMYISIHLNSISSSTWSGAQVFYDDVNEKNYNFLNINNNIIKKYGITIMTINTNMIHIRHIIIEISELMSMTVEIQTHLLQTFFLKIAS